MVTTLETPFYAPNGGDVKTTPAGLLPLLTQKDDLSWQEMSASGMREWGGLLAAQAEQHYGDGANPRPVCHELNKRLPSCAIVTGDRGTTADYPHPETAPWMLGSLLTQTKGRVPRPRAGRSPSTQATQSAVMPKVEVIGARSGPAYTGEGSDGDSLRL